MAISRDFVLSSLTYHERSDENGGTDARLTGWVAHPFAHFAKGWGAGMPIARDFDLSSLSNQTRMRGQTRRSPGPLWSLADDILIADRRGARGFDFPDRSHKMGAPSLRLL